MNASVDIVSGGGGATCLDMSQSATAADSVRVAENIDYEKSISMLRGDILWRAKEISVAHFALHSIKRYKQLTQNSEVNNIAR